MMSDSVDDVLAEVGLAAEARSACMELVGSAESCFVLSCDDGGSSWGGVGVDWELYGRLRRAVDELGVLLDGYGVMDDLDEDED